jgi:mannosidase alpha-like ER degradation enhancer 1
MTVSVHTRDAIPMHTYISYGSSRSISIPHTCFPHSRSVRIMPIPFIAILLLLLLNISFTHGIGNEQTSSSIQSNPDEQSQPQHSPQINNETTWSEEEEVFELPPIPPEVQELIDLLEKTLMETKEKRIKEEQEQPVLSDKRQSVSVQTERWNASRRSLMRIRVKNMFSNAFDAYMRYAFPHDELKPISQTWTDSMAELGNAKDSAPKYNNEQSKQTKIKKIPYQGMALTLIDSLSTLAVLEENELFCAGVEYLSRKLSFDADLRVHLFELNIRILGGLLSAHLLITDPDRGPALTKGVEFIPFDAPPGSTNKIKFEYNNELLEKSKDLGERMLKAFTTQNNPLYSPIPYAFVHMQSGILSNESESTCAAGAGTLILEFGVLSALTNDPKFINAADGALNAIWTLRHPHTDLFPSTFNRRGNVLDPITGVGSSVDSLYEYLFKGGLLFNNGKLQDMANQALEASELLTKVQVLFESNMTDLYTDSACILGKKHYHARPPNNLEYCEAYSQHDWMIEVNYSNGQHAHYQFNALQAFYPALLVLAGRVDEARSLFASFFSVLQRFDGVLPERFYFIQNQIHPTEKAYPLRPEMSESAYMLYRATKDELYLDAAEEIINGLEKHAAVETGGFAGIQTCKQTGNIRDTETSSSHQEQSSSSPSKLKLVPVKSNKQKNQRSFTTTSSSISPEEKSEARKTKDLKEDSSSSTDSSSTGKLPQIDRMESFFLAETLKYLYLIFAEDETSAFEAKKLGLNIQPHWLHRPHLPYNGASDWLFSTEGHLFPLKKQITQSSYNDDHIVYGSIGRAPIHQKEYDEAMEEGREITGIGATWEDMELWDAKRRFDLRCEIVGRDAAWKELSITDPIQFPIIARLRTLIALGAPMEPPGSPLGSAHGEHTFYTSSAEGKSIALNTKLPHPFAHMVRYRDGFFHPELISSAADPKEYHKYAYYHRRWLGEETARGGQEDPLLLTGAVTPAKGTPFTASFTRSEFHPPITVRDALLSPHIISTDALPVSMCPLHGHLLSAGLRTSLPKSWWAYDAEVMRWTVKRVTDAQRSLEYEQWKLKKTQIIQTQLEQTAALLKQTQTQLHTLDKVKPSTLTTKPIKSTTTTTKKTEKTTAAREKVSSKAKGSDDDDDKGKTTKFEFNIPLSADQKALFTGGNLKENFQKVGKVVGESLKLLGKAATKLKKAGNEDDDDDDEQDEVEGSEQFQQIVGHLKELKQKLQQQREQQQEPAAKQQQPPSVKQQPPVQPVKQQTVKQQAPVLQLKQQPPVQSVKQTPVQPMKQEPPVQPPQSSPSSTIPAAGTAGTDTLILDPLSPHWQLGNPFPDGTVHVPKVVNMGSFSVSSQPGSFVIVHTATQATLTVRNLASPVVEIVHEYPEPQSLDVDIRPPRVHFFTMETEESYIHSFTVSVHGASSQCQGTVAASGGHFGAVLPPLSANPATSPFLASADALTSPSFDAISTLRRLGQARHGETGLLRAYLVAAKSPLACAPIPHKEAARLRGHIVLVERGECSFLDKASHLHAAGAIGMLVWNRAQPNFLFQMGTDDSSRDVPSSSLMVNEAGGTWIRNCLDKQSDKRISITFKRGTWESGEKIIVPPSPIPTLALSSTSTKHQQDSSLYVSLTGTADHFVFRSMGGWKASIDWDEKKHSYQLKLH